MKGLACCATALFVCAPLIGCNGSAPTPAAAQPQAGPMPTTSAPSSGGSGHAQGGNAGHAADGVDAAAAGSGGAGKPALDAGAGGAAGLAAAGAPAAGGASGASAAGSGGAMSTGCGAPGLLLCEDFEAGTSVGMAPPSPRWQLARIGEGSVVIDGATAAHSGTKSVHVSSAGGYQTFFSISGAPVFPATGALYLRLYIRLGAPMPMGHNTYYKAGAGGSSSSEHETRVGVMNAMLMINQPAGDRGFLSNQNFYNDGNKPGVVFVPGTWTCVEALFDPAHSTIELWVDGKEVPDLHRTDWQQDPLGAFHFGYEKYAGPDADIWYDDIAVSRDRIGC